MQKQYQTHEHSRTDYFPSYTRSKEHIYSYPVKTKMFQEKRLHRKPMTSHYEISLLTIFIVLSISITDRAIQNKRVRGP